MAVNYNDDELNQVKNKCTICSKIIASNEIKIIPNCGHEFHHKCIHVYINNMTIENYSNLSFLNIKCPNIKCNLPINYIIDNNIICYTSYTSLFFECIGKLQIIMFYCLVTGITIALTIFIVSCPLYYLYCLVYWDFSEKSPSIYHIFGFIILMISTLACCERIMFYCTEISKHYNNGLTCCEKFNLMYNNLKKNIYKPVLDEIHDDYV